MGYLIYCIDEKEPVPRRIALKLACDGPHATAKPLVPRLEAVFEEPQYRGYPHMRTAASRAGWRWTEGGKVLGPCCTGRAPHPPSKQEKLDV